MKIPQTLNPTGLSIPVAFVAGLIMGIVLGWFLRATFTPAAEDPEAAFRRIQSAHLARLDRAAETSRVVFLGSSTFQGLDTTAITPLALNLSIGGDTIEGLIQRASTYQSVRGAAVVVLNIGFNDVVRTCETVDSSRWKDVLRQVPANTPIIAVGLQGVSVASRSRLCRGETGELVKESNSELERQCAAISHCRFVPNPVPALTLDTHARLQEPDGIHLSPIGYGLLIEAIRDALGSSLQASRQ